MVTKALSTVSRCEMLCQGDKIIVALSGGADSVALLHILYSIKEKYNLTLYAAHLNHSIRGEEALRDESFCAEFCKGLGVELFRKTADVPALSAQRGISEELCGRQERYGFFEELSQRLGAKIATAHTASDNAETLIFNLCRGASVSGVCGIPPKRGNIIRPLIECTRAEVEEYCKKNGLAFVTDSTNLSPDYTRNRIRLEIIPKLRQINPSFEEAALRFCRSAAEARSCLEAQARGLIEHSRTDYGFSAERLLNADAAVLHTAIALLCQKYAGKAPESRHIGLIDDILRKGGAVELQRGVTAVCRQGVLRFAREASAGGLWLSFNSDADFEYNGYNVKAKANKILFENYNLTFRTRQGGDSFFAAGRNVNKELRKLLNEKKIPAELRDKLVLLCLDSEVLWCQRVGYSKRGEELRRSAGLNIEITEI